MTFSTITTRVVMICNIIPLSSFIQYAALRTLLQISICILNFVLNLSFTHRLYVITRLSLLRRAAQSPDCRKALAFLRPLAARCPRSAVANGVLPSNYGCQRV